MDARQHGSRPGRVPVGRLALPLAVLVALTGVLLVSCAREKAVPADDGRPVVAVSVAPLGWVVRRLAGDRVTLEVMVPAGASPATHEPTLAQMQAIAKARLYVKVGHPAFAFERAWLGRLLERNSAMQIVSAAGRAPAGPDDPHLWTSPRVMRSLAADVASALQELLPDQAAQIQDSLAVVEGRIDALDAEIGALLQDVRGRTFYVFHPAWGWFASDYGLHQVAIEEKGEHGSEPSPDHLARLIQQARADKTRTVFVQPQSSDRSAKLVAREIGARVEVVDPLADDWLTNLRHVAETMRKAWTP